jgi:putative flippase GtrA
VIARGAILGLIVSFAFYSSTGFNDVVSFLAGIIYGIIIEFVAFKFGAHRS